jgi:hypothetical protein
MNNKTKGNILLLIFFSPVILFALLMLVGIIKSVVQDFGFLWPVSISLIVISWGMIANRAANYLKMEEKESVA